MGGGEAENLSDFSARIALGVLSQLKRVEALGLGSFKGKWVPMDHSKSKKHEGLAVVLTMASNTLKKIRIHVLDEMADGVVGAVDLVVFGGKGLEEEGGEGGGGDVLGGEPEDVSDLFARIELGRLGKLEHCVALVVFSGEGKGVSVDH